MGDASAKGSERLRADVAALRAALDAVPAAASIVHRLAVEDDTIEITVVPNTSARSRRMKFLVYEVDAYPKSGGMFMTEDEQDESVVEAINELLGEMDRICLAHVFCTACREIGVQDSDVLGCVGGHSRAEGASPVLAEKASPAQADDDLEFECDDDEGANYNMYIDDIADREDRPGWKKIKWQEVEEQRMALKREQDVMTGPNAKRGQKRRQGDLSEMTSEERKASDEQMWSSKEAFTILANELFSIQTEGDPGIQADATEYDVHHWTVRLSCCSGPLGADLRDLKSRFGYDYIELQLFFKEDLHPFYPPVTTIVRPRLTGQHDILSAVACHPRLQLKGWSPFQTSKDMLRSIRGFLEGVARVDLASEQNDLANFPGGAFSQLDRLLAQLGSLCELVPADLRPDHPGNPYKADPWAQNEELTQSSLGAMLARRRSQRSGSQRAVSAAPAAAAQGDEGLEATLLDLAGGVCVPGLLKEDSRKRYWAAGTGYGSEYSGKTPGEMWDPGAMQAVQQAQDEELKRLVGTVTDILHQEGTGTFCSVGGSGAGGASGGYPSAGGGSSSSGSGSKSPGCGADGGGIKRELAEAMLKSCLPPFLQRELATSYTNMCDRLAFFEEVYRLTQELLRGLAPEALSTLFHPLRGHLQAAKASAQTFLAVLGDAVEHKKVSGDVSFARTVVQIAEDCERLCRASESLMPQQPIGASGPSMEMGGSSSSSSAVVPLDQEAEYCRRLRCMQLDSGDLAELAEHRYSKLAQAEHDAPHSRTVRLAKELAGLSSLLPLSGSSSVFVRTCESRQQLWCALVTGPDDSPYSGGCFVFDIYFPQMYPQVPPQVQLRTTGHNTVTFNPNLYSSGKVCLSLLGTWKGDRSESWDPSSSRTLQVLISIQSLILVPEPYFNEPGFEREIGTEMGMRNSWKYTMPVRENCIRWAMIDILKSPPAEFKDVVYEHFRLRGDRIKEVIRGWIAEAERWKDQRHKTNLESLLNIFCQTLESQLGAEPAPPVAGEVQSAD